MPTSVLPAWVKYLLLIAGVAVVWWSFAGKNKSPENGKSACLACESSGSARGFPAKAGVNIRQFVTNPLEPTPVDSEGPLILRDLGTDYYRDQP